jgi:hypothetical protein
VPTLFRNTYQPKHSQHGTNELSQVLVATVVSQPSIDDRLNKVGVYESWLAFGISLAFQPICAVQLEQVAWLAVELSLFVDGRHPKPRQHPASGFAFTFVVI